MKEFISYIKKMDFNNLFYAQTENTLIQLFRYCFVGGGAFIVDWLTMVVLTKLGMHYLISTVVGFIFGLAVNFLLSKMFVFKQNSEKVGIVGEFINYAIIGVIGLGLTEVFMYIFTDLCNIHYAISKIVSAVIVLIWNFFARKVTLYSKNGGKKA